MQGKGGLFGKIESTLKQGNLVIAVVPGSPKIHFVVIKGWEKWSFSGGTGHGKSREFDSERLVPKTTTRAKHYDGIMGDFIINDPEATGPRTHLFANYGLIYRLYVVRPA
jgi:hypothetical protein